MIFKKFRKNNSLHKINQDSRLRGNDGDLLFLVAFLGFAEVSGCHKTSSPNPNKQHTKKQPKTTHLSFSGCLSIKAITQPQQPQPP
ncbi:MAG: hypothetical protein D8B42_09210 [Kingella sp. (in: b-proteobacteria)]|nr:MAG: hypothetical protein D8B42_09210 [Kingella sp. (in: b-proteobacteria)]